MNLHDKLSKGLEHCYAKLKGHTEKQENDLDSSIKVWKPKNLTYSSFDLNFVVEE